MAAIVQLDQRGSVSRRWAQASRSLTTCCEKVVPSASVEVTSERELYPVDHLFDGRSGAGGSCWVAKKAGAQTIHLRFERAIDFERLIIESEERGSTCSQQIDVSLTGTRQNGSEPYEAPPRVFRFAPYGPTFHREVWALSAHGLTEVRIRVTPDPPSRFASLTSILFR